ncbi:hypothetical protein [Paeniglutamicibacter terrestris]|uniref:Uncharacterized protein n=1 Tax=Paeniglutamicibacter terrestris TaxID=2723403 RepID=A0ABX1GAK0_9MICC|nr:hypothetical protein [Paeniglutamicibacter terrestris]NKG22397.1 hypothetical protein [Paeniglutamicibacter terrestris]
MSTPAHSAAPDSPTAASPLRQGGGFFKWFSGIADWIRALSPAGEPYTTEWWAGPGKIDQVMDLVTSD